MCGHGLNFASSRNEFCIWDRSSICQFILPWPIYLHDLGDEDGDIYLQYYHQRYTNKGAESRDFGGI
jgi:hypothetical protein